MQKEVVSCVNVWWRHAYAHPGQMPIRVEGSTVVDIGGLMVGGAIFSSGLMERCLEEQGQ
ncbi:hypothetical protein ACS0TY_012546 [Phlomoides rotata]